MRARHDVRALFLDAFDRTPSVIASAPGRVNLIGEHTDYNGGFVLPIAIPQRTTVALAPREDRAVRAVSANVDGGSPAGFELGHERKRGAWIDYVQGSITALRTTGVDVSGFDLVIASDVPVGAGLSSSAALEVALLRALREAFGLRIDDVALAKAGRAAETDFIGAPIGIMDQMAASLADETAALFIDTRSLEHVRVSLPSDVELVVVDSGVAHDHATGEYATRRAECEQAASALGVALLREIIDAVAVDVLPEPLRRRARHVITEDARVLEAVACLRAGDTVRLGKLLDASHESLRTDFEVTVTEVDRLVGIAQRDHDVLGARMTGGGFGGAIVALAKAGQGRAAATRIVDAYGAPGRVLVPESPE
jgi:galactokinase